MLDYSASASLININSIFTFIGFHSDIEFFNIIPLEIYCFLGPPSQRRTIVLSRNRYGLKGCIHLHSNSIFLRSHTIFIGTTEQKISLIDALYYLVNNKYD